jgi:hypothetical protein
MKPENRGLLPVFIAVIVLSLVAFAFQPLSLTRSTILATAILLFTGGILFFMIRGGWMTERRSPKGPFYSIVMIVVSSSVFYVSVTSRDLLHQWAIADLLRGLLGLMSACTALDRIGALLATLGRKGISSEQKSRAYR